MSPPHPGTITMHAHSLSVTRQLILMFEKIRLVNQVNLPVAVILVEITKNKKSA